MKRTRGDQASSARSASSSTSVPDASTSAPTRRTADRDRSGDVSVDYTLTVPSGASIEMKSVSGNVKVTGVRGSVRAESVSGNVTTTDTPRLEAAKSVSGDVSLSGIAIDGDLAAGSVSGNVTAKGVKAHGLDLGR